MNEHDAQARVSERDECYPDRVRVLVDESCHHCGQQPEADGDHSCPCPNTDSECLEHTLRPMGPRSDDLRVALDGGEE